MVHRKIIDPVLKNLGPSRADYFNRLVARVERDPRTETVPNLVYLVLREMIPYLPADLPQEELADQLLDFVIGSQGWLNRVIHARRFIEVPGRLAEVTKEFVLQVLALAMDQHRSTKSRPPRCAKRRPTGFHAPKATKTTFPTGTTNKRLVDFIH